MRKVGVFFNQVNHRMAEIWHKPETPAWPYSVRTYEKGELAGILSFPSRLAADEMAVEWVNFPAINGRG